MRKQEPGQKPKADVEHRRIKRSVKWQYPGLK